MQVRIVNKQHYHNLALDGGSGACSTNLMSVQYAHQKASDHANISQNNRLSL